ncbi:MAG TPA: hypothetical protein VFP96_13305 [Candidatus Acidoferrum sp.]|nr:hypothetical protein [Candidatus Acidoferrum sp.]
MPDIRGDGADHRDHSFRFDIANVSRQSGFTCRTGQPAASLRQVVDGIFAEVDKVAAEALERIQEFCLLETWKSCYESGSKRTVQSRVSAIEKSS